MGLNANFSPRKIQQIFHARRLWLSLSLFWRLKFIFEAIAASYIEEFLLQSTLNKLVVHFTSVNVILLLSKFTSFIHYSQCGNFMTFLSLRFYVKSILVNSTSAKSAILTHLEPQNFDFYDFLLFLMAEIHLNDKIQRP